MSEKEDQYKKRCTYLTQKIEELFLLLREEFLISREELDELMNLLAKVLKDNDITK